MSNCNNTSECKKKCSLKHNTILSKMPEMPFLSQSNQLQMDKIKLILLYIFFHWSSCFTQETKQVMGQTGLQMSLYTHCNTSIGAIRILSRYAMFKLAGAFPGTQTSATCWATENSTKTNVFDRCIYHISFIS